MDSETERLWSDYVASEQVRIRPQSNAALDRFIERLLSLDPERWMEWGAAFAKRAEGAKAEVPLRFPLFRRVVFPALLEHIRRSEPGSAWLLSQFAQLLYKSKEGCSLSNSRWTPGTGLHASAWFS
jgi:hypothetical protein